MGVELLADRAYRAVADNCQRRPDVHSWQEAVAGLSQFIDPLIDEADSDDLVVLDQGSGNRCPWPDLNRAAALHLGADPLQKLSQPEHETAAFVKKRRRPRQFEGLMPHRQNAFEQTQHPVRAPQDCRPPARADRVEQIQDLLLGDRCAHWDAGPVKIGKSRPQAMPAGHHAGDAKADVVGALVAHDLKGQTGHNRAFNGRTAIGIDELFRKRCQKPGRRRTEPDADDVHIESLAIQTGRIGLSGCCFHDTGSGLRRPSRDVKFKRGAGQLHGSCCPWAAWMLWSLPVGES